MTTNNGFKESPTRSNCAFIQIACGAQTDLVALTMRRHAEYCARHEMDYLLFVYPESDYQVYLGYVFEKELEAVRAGYRYIVFCDSDAMVVDFDRDLREACPADGFGATWHDSADWGDDRLYDHFNLGCHYIGAGPRAVAFLREWAAADRTQHPWVAQHVFNQTVPRDLVVTLGHEWNCTPSHSAPNPVVLAWHGVGTTSQRRELMRKAVEESASQIQFDNLDLTLEEAYNRAWHAQMSGRPQEAGMIYRALLQAQPDSPEVLRQYGILLSEANKDDESLLYLRQAVQYAPSDSIAWNALSAAYSKLGRDRESIDAVNRALEIAPDMPAAKWNSATPLLRSGRWAEGWSAYEWGKGQGVRSYRFPRHPEWCGDDLTGKTVYVWAEQGFGDTLNFLQLLKPLRDRFNPARIVLEVQREVCALLQCCALADEVVPKPDDRHRPRVFDEHVALMSLPLVLGLMPDDLPAAVGYLPGAQTPGSGVGICGAGSPTHWDDRNRSIGTDRLEQALGVPCVRLTADNPECAHWQATARAMAGCELVVTVDTAVAHLAGAMGIPCWILLPYAADFRWLTGRCDTPWYPSVRLFRQLAPGDWDSVLSEVRECLTR